MLALFGAVGVPFATQAVSDAIVIVGLDADMSSGAAVGGRSMRLSGVPRIVYAAKTFGEAERCLANERVDLVILDLMLPDGIRAALVKSQTSKDELLQVIHLAIEKGKEVAEPLS